MAASCMLVSSVRAPALSIEIKSVVSKPWTVSTSTYLLIEGTYPLQYTAMFGGHFIVSLIIFRYVVLSPADPTPCVIVRDETRSLRSNFTCSLSTPGSTYTRAEWNTLCVAVSRLPNLFMSWFMSSFSGCVSMCFISSTYCLIFSASTATVSSNGSWLDCAGPLST